MQQSHHKTFSRMHCQIMIESKNNMEKTETDKMQPTKALNMKEHAVERERLG